MFHTITVATSNFFPYTRRLWASLGNSGNQCRLTIFCDAPQTFQSLERKDFCVVRHLPEIAELGVKRAKFTAYQIALNEGGFVYLDSDVIVLQPIAELATGDLITGCFDDLRAVQGIPDRTHPWPAAPGLENRRFINSGVFYAPAERREFFHELYQRSLDDGLWDRYILPGRIYDNSFLCAHLNLMHEPVHYVDEEVYNWQGLTADGRLQVERRENRLVNRQTGKTLKIAHFAGISEPDRVMGKWPVEVTSLLVAMGSEELVRPETAYVEFLGTLSDQFARPAQDPLPMKALNLLSQEAVDLFTAGLHADYSSRRSYLGNPAAMISLGYSLPYTGYRWNELSCGNAYLDGEEYNFLQRLIEHYNIRTAIETGAGETSILMRALGVEALSIEASPGPWLQRAIDEGCRCVRVDFNPETNRFDDAALNAALADFTPEGKIDLLLIDSPPGTAARNGVAAQIAAIAGPQYVLVHDALRDACVVFECQHRFGMEMVEYLPSERGFVLLRSRSAALASALPLPQFERELRVSNPRVLIECSADGNHRGSSLEELWIRVTNLAAQPLSSHYANPVNVSYHLMSPNGDVLVWDGVRTALPFDVLPGNTAEFRAKLQVPEAHSELLLGLTLVQENIGWFDEVDPNNRLLLRIGVNSHGKQFISDRLPLHAAA